MLPHRRHFFIYSCLVVALLLASCGPTSLEDFRKEGEAICRSLVHDLQKIQSREELVRAAPHLKKRFSQLVGSIIEARLYQRESSEESSFEPNAFDALLLFELKRIYAIEGAREIMESVEREALIRLDGFRERGAPQKPTSGF